MRIAVLFSGGKDSTFATYVSMQHGWDVSYLISVYPEPESLMFHVPNIHLTPLLAQAMGIEYISVHAKDELLGLKNSLSDLDIDGVVSGAVASEYQRTRIEGICEELGIKSFTPLWHKDPNVLLKDILDAGFDVMVVGVFAEGFDSSWLGRRIDEGVYQDLLNLNKRYGINISGEGGEYETLVLDAPFFKKKMKILKSTQEWHGTYGTLALEAGLVDRCV